jgi:hypothetical protein
LEDGSYLFGFNGQERRDDYAGVGNHNHALFWEYDTRIGRRWNLDPVDQVNISNYAVNGNCPIAFNDPWGDDFKNALGEIVKAGENIVANATGTVISNITAVGNWNFGIWNPDTKTYDLHNFEKTDGFRVPGGSPPRDPPAMVLMPLNNGSVPVQNPSKKSVDRRVVPDVSASGTTGLFPMLA